MDGKLQPFRPGLPVRGGQLDICHAWHIQVIMADDEQHPKRDDGRSSIGYMLSGKGCWHGLWVVEWGLPPAFERLGRVKREAPGVCGKGRLSENS